MGLRRWLIGACICIAATGAEIKIAFSTLERVIGEQAFTDEGRRYVKGNRQTKCQFAYLEKPKIAGSGSQLVIHARFTGRSALNVLGQCVGVGDAFDLTIYATPKYLKGQVALDQLSIETARDSFYIRRVRAELARALTKPFDYNLADDVRRMFQLAPAGPNFQMRLDKFDVTGMRAAEDGVVLTVDFMVLVK